VCSPQCIALQLKGEKGKGGREGGRDREREREERRGREDGWEEEKQRIETFPHSC